jgi:putative intracellular protease/amidase
VFAIASIQASTHPQYLPRVTAPHELFGAAIGDDYFLATYRQMDAYWKQLDRESDRMTLVDIGRTEEGRTQWMAVITAPENQAALDRYRETSRRLAYAEGLSDAQARSLAADGKAVVFIAGGLHADEVLGAQQLIQTAYDLVRSNDPETEAILRDVIVLLVHANPDGHDLVGDRYMGEPDPRRRRLDDLPRLYQKYVGHDNNRDFYMTTQAETANINRVLYRQWLPQIVYDHHQAPLVDALMIAPPFAGPSNDLFDPLIADGIERVAGAMHDRFAAERKTAIATASAGSTYSTWWNGGLRTTAYFHNQIGILTETGGSPSRRDRWPFRLAVEYSVSANRAVLDVAGRHRETWLYNIYRMGKNSIERGTRGPSGYILPADQADFLTATKFVNALLKTGVTVHRATAPFHVGGRRYPQDSYVVKTAQAFRPHVLDMFEPQHYPDGGMDDEAVQRPYDVAGWTLALQMGVAFDRIEDPFDGPFEPIAQIAQPAAQHVPDAPGYLLDARQNDAAIVVNRLLAAGEDVSRVTGTGDLYVDATPAAVDVIRRAAAEMGLSVRGSAAPPSRAVKLAPARVALVDRAGGWSTSGWIRWLLERYEFPFDVVRPDTLDAGLAGRYDLLILPGEAVPGNGPDSAVTRSRTLPALKQFVAGGGTVVAIGGAAVIGRHLGLPVSYPLAGLPPDRFDIPGSVLRAAVDTGVPAAYGFGDHADVFFDNGPVFRLQTGAEASGVRRIAWFDGPSVLRSGWARGQQYLHGTVAALEAPLGHGRVLLFGPDVTFRAQSHGTFKFLFNTIYYAAARRP